ncbi:MAG TPA: DUF3105 domain-containing protein [Jatrophihabitans sp.]|nr:DUF3105 domain-containing protein [Jatrophihabitans sp.]
MAQRKTPASNRPPSSSKTGKAGSSARPGGGPAGRPPARPKKKGKSIVNQRQTPWGLIATTAAVVAFAVAVVLIVVFTRGNSSNSPTAKAAALHNTVGGQSVDPADPYRQPELAAAKSIKGLTYRVEAQHTHVPGVIHYDSSPPVGGNHSQYWADCTGTVYPKAIANENAVHMLEHGAIWITYNPRTLPKSELPQLEKYVSGVDRMAMSPYPGLKTPISLQAWGYQLFVNKASDPRIQQFISLLKYNQQTTPEYGATCSQPSFKQHPSTFGHPLWQPAAGAQGNVMGR